MIRRFCFFRGGSWNEERRGEGNTEKTISGRQFFEQPKGDIRLQETTEGNFGEFSKAFPLL